MIGHIEEKKMGDGSSVWNLIYETNSGDQFLFACVDEASAWNLMEVLDFGVIDIRFIG